MTRQRYSAKESLQRILRLFEGKAVPTDVPGTVSGVLLSEDESLSDLAEVLAGSLPSETATLPPSVSVPYINLDPRYGGIYVWTGTSTMQSLGTPFTKITGSFQNSMVGATGMTLQPTNDRILITNDYGYYMIFWQATILGSSAVTYAIEPYIQEPGAGSMLGMPQAVGSANPSASGSTTSLSGMGITYLSGTSTQVDLRVSVGQTAWMKFQAGQLLVWKLDTA